MLTSYANSCQQKHAPIPQQHYPQRLLFLRITKFSKIHCFYCVSDALFTHRLNRLLNFRDAPPRANISLSIPYASVETSSTMFGLHLETSKAMPQSQLHVMAEHKLEPQKHSGWQHSHHSDLIPGKQSSPQHDIDLSVPRDVQRMAVGRTRFSAFLKIRPTAGQKCLPIQPDLPARCINVFCHHRTCKRHLDCFPFPKFIFSFVVHVFMPDGWQLFPAPITRLLVTNFVTLNPSLIAALVSCNVAHIFTFIITSVDPLIPLLPRDTALPLFPFCLPAIRSFLM
jgi:hypothetical protein